MNNYMDLKNIVLLGRTFEEYCKMFDLDKTTLENNKILDVASGVSSFCAEANAKKFDVTASDKIYYLGPDEIEIKCAHDLDSVMEQMPGIADNYRWDFFKDIPSLRSHREKAYRSFLGDFRKCGRRRYIPVDYPVTGFLSGQFDISLVSHFLFLYEDKLDYDFHKKTILELLRISNREIRIFPLVNLKGNRSKHIDILAHDKDLRNPEISIRKVGYEFMKNANEMMVIRKQENYGK